MDEGRIFPKDKDKTLWSQYLFSRYTCRGKTNTLVANPLYNAEIDEYIWLLGFWEYRERGLGFSVTKRDIEDFYYLSQEDIYKLEDEIALGYLAKIKI